LSLKKHAENELRIAGLFDKDSDYGGMLGEAALEIVEVFAKQGHSGMSASMVTSIVEKLMRFEPLTPLTGDDDEWCEFSPGKFQNKRYSSVFKDGKDGVAKDNNAQVKVDPKGGCWHAPGLPIEFPYMPPKERIKILCDDDLNPIKN